MANAIPTISDFKARFDRDFPFGTGMDTVRDKDITNAIADAALVFNADLWSQPDESSVAYLYAAAHFLALSLQDAGGLSALGPKRGQNSHGGGVILTKSVGQVSVTYAPPDWVIQSPNLNQFMRTGYGQKYLQLLTPRLVGGVYVVDGFNDVTPQGPAIWNPGF